jgi:hypothetical protein
MAHEQDVRVFAEGIGARFSDGLGTIRLQVGGQFLVVVCGGRQRGQQLVRASWRLPPAPRPAPFPPSPCARSCAAQRSPRSPVETLSRKPQTA